MEKNEAVADALRTRRYRRLARASLDCIRNSIAKTVVVMERVEDGVVLLQAGWLFVIATSNRSLLTGAAESGAEWFTRLTTFEVHYVNKQER